MPRDHGVVSSGLIALARPRPGHFDLGTGFHGDVWLDLDALFLRPVLLRPRVRWLADRLRGHQVDVVCGPIEGGAFLAQAVADILGPGWPGAGGQGKARGIGQGVTVGRENSADIEIYHEDHDAGQPVVLITGTRSAAGPGTGRSRSC